MLIFCKTPDPFTYFSLAHAWTHFISSPRSTPILCFASFMISNENHEIKGILTVKSYNIYEH